MKHHKFLRTIQVIFILMAVFFIYGSTISLIERDTPKFRHGTVMCLICWWVAFCRIPDKIRRANYQKPNDNP